MGHHLPDRSQGAWRISVDRAAALGNSPSYNTAARIERPADPGTHNLQTTYNLISSPR
jgi:hypothetical protein